MARISKKLILRPCLKVLKLTDDLNVGIGLYIETEENSVSKLGNLKLREFQSRSRSVILILLIADHCN